MERARGEREKPGAAAGRALETVWETGPDPNLRDAGDYQEPETDGKRETLLERALVIQEETLGAEHPRVALTLTHLMFLYRRQGQEAAAAAAAARATMILARQAR